MTKYRHFHLNGDDLKIREGNIRLIFEKKNRFRREWEYRDQIFIEG